jgi:hypothetical protein
MFNSLLSLKHSLYFDLVLYLVSWHEHIVTWWLKVGIVEQIHVAIARQQREHMFAAMNEQATVEEPLELVSSMRFMPKLYNEDDFASESAVSSLELHC